MILNIAIILIQKQMRWISFKRSNKIFGLHQQLKLLVITNVNSLYKHLKINLKENENISGIKRKLFHVGFWGLWKDFKKVVEQSLSILAFWLNFFFHYLLENIAHEFLLRSHNDIFNGKQIDYSRFPPMVKYK